MFLITYYLRLSSLVALGIGLVYLIALLLLRSLSRFLGISSRIISCSLCEGCIREVSATLLFKYIPHFGPP